MERLDSRARRLCLDFLADPAAPREVPVPEPLRLAGVLPAGRLGVAAWQRECAAAQAVDATARGRPELAALLAAGLPAPTPLPIRRDIGRFLVSGDPGTGYDSGDALYLLDVFPHREKENDLDLRDRLPLFLAWALVRLAPENAARPVHLCALVQKAPGKPRADCLPDGLWQAGIGQWDRDFCAAGTAARTLFLEDLEARVLELLELWARPATQPAWYFPRAAAALAIRQKDAAAEGAWQAERGYTPGYARLLGRGLDFEEGTADFERLKAQSEALVRLITLGEEAGE